MHEGFLSSAMRLPLLFRGDVMRPSSIVLLGLGVPLLLVLLVVQVRRGMGLRTASLWAVLGVYSLWAAGLLFGAPLARPDDAYLAGHWINLVPFATILDQVRSGRGSALVQLVGNVGLLLPLGLLGPVVMPSLRRVGRLALVALGGAVAIELIQLVATGARLIDRSVDIDDVILNVAGALLGWLVWRGVALLWERLPRLGLGQSRA